MYQAIPQAGCPTLLVNRDYYYVRLNDIKFEAPLLLLDVLENTQTTQLQVSFQSRLLYFQSTRRALNFRAEESVRKML